MLVEKGGGVGRGTQRYYIALIDTIIKGDFIAEFMLGIIAYGNWSLLDEYSQFLCALVCFV